jgi:hypothetical protein
MVGFRMKRKIVRSVIADAIIESARFFEGVLVFCLENGLNCMSRYLTQLFKSCEIT